MADLSLSPVPDPGADSAFPVFETVNPEGGDDFIVLCDHASNAIPPEYGTLGLPEAELKRHIAWDIGAADVARRLAGLLGVTGVLSHFSRLLIDPNRGDDDPTLVMKLSDGAIIPGNRVADAAEVARRTERFWRPYHNAIDARIDAALSRGAVPAIVSIHSFTPYWRGTQRPWHAGVLWDRDPRLPLPLLARLRNEPGLVVGDNEPYSGRLKGDVMNLHGTQRGIAHVLVEIRQDLIDHEAGAQEWAQRLAACLTDIRLHEAEALGTVRHHDGT